MKATLKIGDRVKCAAVTQEELDNFVKELEKVTIVPEYMVFKAENINGSRAAVLGKEGTILNIDEEGMEYLILFDRLGRKSCAFPGISKAETK